MPLAARVFVVVALALMTATCGQKGPLTPPAGYGATTTIAASDPEAAPSA